MLHEKNVTGLKQISRRFWQNQQKKLDVLNEAKNTLLILLNLWKQDVIYRGHFNIMNEGCITNLPWESVVEVPCYVDGNGISIPKVGDLPLGCAAVCSQSIWVQKLAIEAAVHGDVQLLKQAAMMDPLTGAVCNPPEIWQMIDEMLVAQEQWLPQYTEAIKAAKEHLANDPLIPTKDYHVLQGSAKKTPEEVAAERVHVKSQPDFSRMLIYEKYTKYSMLINTYILLNTKADTFICASFLYFICKFISNNSLSLLRNNLYCF